MKANMISKVASILLVGVSFSMTGCSGGGSDSANDPDLVFTPAGTALVSGTVATADSGVVASASIFSASATTADVDNTTTARLIVDTNNDGEFGNKDDAIFSSSVKTDGSFDFGKIGVNKSGETRAQITVQKQGFAPYRKIVTLVNGQTVSVVADAASTPLSVEAVNLTELRAQGTLSSSFLKLGTMKSGATVSSYANILSFSQMQAEADVPLSSDAESESIIPLSAIPDSVEVINAQMQIFDPTDPEDAQKFPGEYVGVGENGNDAERLVSVGFDYMSLTDQNGNPIELNATAMSAASKLLPQAVDYTSCLRASTQYIGATQLELIKKYGDDDNTTAAFEIPLWYYNNSAGNWGYLGQAEVKNSDGTTDYNASSSETSAYAKMCITANWGTSINLDYSFALEQPTNVCVSAKDQDDKAISNLYVTAKKDTAYDGRYLNKDGNATLALVAGSDVADYTFAYSGTLTGWSSVEVNASSVTVGGASGCDNTLSIEVVNPYSATLKVYAKELDGSVAKSKYVNVYNSNWNDYYYQSAVTDENGLVTFKVKPSVAYIASYNYNTANVTINGALVAPETADDGRFATVTVQEVQVAPQVYTYMSSNSISTAAKSVNFYVYAWDDNGDAVSLSSLALNGTALTAGTDYTVKTTYDESSYQYFEATLNLESATVSAITPTALATGNYSLVATYSDGKAQGTGTASLTVAANRAPIVSSIYFSLADKYLYTYYTGKLLAGENSLYVYAYDPDGDTITTTYSLDGAASVDIGTANTAMLNLTDGAHTLTVTSTDGTLPASKTFTFFVGNNAPVITSFGSTSYSVDLASDATKIKLFAYATDKEGGSLTVQTTSGIALTPYNGYFRSADITIDGNTTFTIVANDGDKNSTAKSLTVTTYKANQAPIFDQALSALTIPAGTTQKFTCSATDPDGDTVTYTWALDGVKQSVTGTEFTHTFTTAALYTLSCTATDDNNEPLSKTSTASITVYNPSATGNLVINTLPGLVVALHDTTTLAPTQTKLADSTGKATFVITGTDRATFSVSVGPDVVLDSTMLFEDEHSWMAYEGYNLCQNSTIDPKPTECATYDRTALLSASVIPNWLLDFVLANDPEMNGINIVASDWDKNSDGGLNNTEFYALVLSVVDANKDGKLSWSEWKEEQNIQTEFFVNVPVRTYNIEMHAYSYSPNEQYYNYDTGVLANVALTGFAPYAVVNSSGSGNMHAYTDANGDANVTMNSMRPQNDGLYSFMFKYNDGNNTSFMFEKDKTEAQIANLAYTPANFNLTADTEVAFTYGKNNYVGVDARYKGLYLDASVNVTNTSSYMYIDNSAFFYSIYGEASFQDPVTYAFMETWHENYYGDGVLKTAYNAADYAFLDVDPTLGSNSINFSGTDLTKVNSLNISYYANEYNSTTQINDSVSIVFHFTVMPASVSKPDFAAILPTGIKEYLIETPTSENMYGDMQEFKDYTETQFIDTVTSENFDSYDSIPMRGMYFTIPTGTVAPSSVVTRNVTPKYTKPFSISYDAREPFAK